MELEGEKKKRIEMVSSDSLSINNVLNRFMYPIYDVPAEGRIIRR